MEQAQELGKGGALFLICFCAYVAWSMFKLQTVTHNIIGGMFAIASVYFGGQLVEKFRND